MVSRLQSPGKFGRLALATLAVAALAGCHGLPERSSDALRGDEIIVAGRYFSTGTRVVTWREPDGYNAYASATENHGRRALDGKRDEERVPSLEDLQRNVDQLVIHYDEEGLSKLCFAVLEDRSLSSQFMIDVDGTIYQTLDLRERAFHASTSNSRGIGIEMANVGAHPPGDAAKLSEWYRRDAAGQTQLVPPAAVGDPRILTPAFVGRPVRSDPVHGRLQNRDLVQYDFTPEQYAALIKLTAALHVILPRIRLDYPRDANGKLIDRKLADKELEDFSGVLGHFHVQENKVDPGPAFQWDRVIEGAREIK